MDVVRIATRQSQLALWQANFVRDQLQTAHPGLRVELVGMTTKGDRWLQAPLSEVGGKGLFVKELESAMLAGEADMAVHSAKDLPAQLPSPFILPLIGFRADVHDVLVGATDLTRLPTDAKVGSSSLRRQAQLLAVRDDLQMLPIRGNVDTRLAKLDNGEFDAIVLAAAGLGRLGIVREDTCLLSTELCLPAPGQGALAIECVSDSPVVGLLEPLLQPAVAGCVTAERGISAGLGADCSLPIAAYAEAKGDQIHLRAALCNAQGTVILRSNQRGSTPQALATQAVADLYDQGAQNILDQLKH